MRIREFELALAIIGPTLQLCVCGLMFFRGVVRNFRGFFSYTAFAFVTGSAAVYVQKLPIYFYYYWSAQIIYLSLAVWALYEIIQQLLFGSRIARAGRAFFLITAFLALAVTLIRNSFLPTAGHPLIQVIVSLEIATRFFQIAILLAFFFIARFFRLHWPHYPFGIALGFMIAASGSLAVFLLRSEFGTKFDSVVRITPPIAYLIAEAVWLVTFVMKPPERASGTVSLPNPDQLLADVKRNTESAKEILKR